MKKISTKGPFPCGAVELEAARQDVELALHEGMKTQMSIDNMQLYMLTIDKNLMTKFAWDDVNNRKLDPVRIREARKAEM